LFSIFSVGVVAPIAVTGGLSGGLGAKGIVLGAEVKVDLLLETDAYSDIYILYLYFYK
jgi:hypothetical protein